MEMKIYKGKTSQGTHYPSPSDNEVMWMHSLFGKGNRDNFVWNHSQGEISTAVHHRTGIHTQIESKANSLHLFAEVRAGNANRRADRTK